MMRPLTFLAALAVVLPALIPSSRAREGTGAGHVITGDLTLDRAVQAALAQNPDILKQLQEIERTKGQIIEVRAQALPHLGVTSYFNYQDLRLLERSGQNGGGSGTVAFSGTATGALGNVDSTAQTNATQQQGSGPGDKSWNVTITAKQVLYAGGQVRAAMNIAKFTGDSSSYQLRDLIDKVIALTRTEFYDVLQPVQVLSNRS